MEHLWSLSNMTRVHVDSVLPYRSKMTQKTPLFPQASAIVVKIIIFNLQKLTNDECLDLIAILEM